MNARLVAVRVWRTAEAPGRPCVRRAGGQIATALGGTTHEERRGIASGSPSPSPSPSP
jgi:hypothetical protein